MSYDIVLILTFIYVHLPSFYSLLAIGLKSKCGTEKILVRKSDKDCEFYPISSNMKFVVQLNSVYSFYLTSVYYIYEIA